MKGGWSKDFQRKGVWVQFLSKWAGLWPWPSGPHLPWDLSPRPRPGVSEFKPEERTGDGGVARPCFLLSTEVSFSF